MELKLQRFEGSQNGKATIGLLFVDKVFECYVLEDVVRAPGVKVPGETAIPAGKYKVVLDFSARFKRIMPHVLDVPGFDGIRVHCGNTDADTEGCLLVGQTHTVGQDHIEGSTLAYAALYPKLEIASRANEPISLEITDLDA